MKHSSEPHTEPERKRRGKNCGENNQQMQTNLHKIILFVNTTCICNYRFLIMFSYFHKINLFIYPKTKPQPKLKAERQHDEDIVRRWKMTRLIPMVMQMVMLNGRIMFCLCCFADSVIPNAGASVAFDLHSDRCRSISNIIAVYADAAVDDVDDADDSTMWKVTQANIDSQSLVFFFSFSFFRFFWWNKSVLAAIHHTGTDTGNNIS